MTGTFGNCSLLLNVKTTSAAADCPWPSGKRRFSSACRSRTLAQAWRNVRGNGTIFGLAVEGIDKFQVVHWCKDELADAYVIPMFAHEATLEAFRPVTFKQWVETKPKVPLHPNHAWDAGEASSTRHRHNQDPALATRIQLFTMQPSEKAIGVIDAYILLDGYHRAVWFWKRETSTERLSVYVPA